MSSGGWNADQPLLDQSINTSANKKGHVWSVCDMISNIALQGVRQTRTLFCPVGVGRFLLGKLLRALIAIMHVFRKILNRLKNFLFCVAFVMDHVSVFYSL